jgi:hypothetical protein
MFIDCCITNVSREIKSRIAMAKAAFSKTLFHRQLDLNLKKKTSKVLHLEDSLYGAETWKLRKIYQKYLESFDM